MLPARHQQDRAVTPDDVPKLFDRFWRRDRARSGSDHSGLGLSLARAFALALGYRLSATLDRGAQLTLTLTLLETSDAAFQRIEG